MLDKQKKDANKYADDRFAAMETSIKSHFDTKFKRLEDLIENKVLLMPAQMKTSFQKDMKEKFEEQKTSFVGIIKS